MRRTVRLAQRPLNADNLRALMLYLRLQDDIVEVPDGEKAVQREGFIEVIDVEGKAIVRFPPGVIMAVSHNREMLSVDLGNGEHYG